MKNSTKIASKRAALLAHRIAQGAEALMELSTSLSEPEWNTPVLGDGRPIGVVVHHVASTYPLEVELAQTLAAGNPITGANKKVIDQMNAEHAEKHNNVTKKEALSLLKKNSHFAVEAIGLFTDEELDSAASVSLNANAPLTAQFFIEDHALRHSFHHLEKIKDTLGAINVN